MNTVKKNSNPTKKKTIHEKLFELQNEISSLSKTKENPFYKSKYFDINDLVHHLKPLLAKHRLLLNQPFKIEDKKMQTLRTIISDIDSEECMTSELYLSEQEKIHDFGSMITYLRRYMLVSMLCLESIDDDANKEQKTTNVVKRKGGNKISEERQQIKNQKF